MKFPPKSSRTFLLTFCDCFRCRSGLHPFRFDPAFCSHCCGRYNCHDLEVSMQIVKELEFSDSSFAIFSENFFTHFDVEEIALIDEMRDCLDCSIVLSFVHYSFAVFLLVFGFDKH
jgi:hypothetical protein